jgi:hypothetical protein
VFSSLLVMFAGQSSRFRRTRSSSPESSESYTRETMAESNATASAFCVLECNECSGSFVSSAGCINDSSSAANFLSNPELDGECIFVLSSSEEERTACSAKENIDAGSAAFRFFDPGLGKLEGTEFTALFSQSSGALGMDGPSGNLVLGSSLSAIAAG